MRRDYALLAIVGVAGVALSRLARRGFVRWRERATAGWPVVHDANG